MLAIVSLYRNPSALWTTGFGFHGVIGGRCVQATILSGYCSTIALHIYRVSHDERTPGTVRCAGIPGRSLGCGEQGRGAAHDGDCNVLRCVEVLAARLGTGVPRAIPPPDEGREGCRIAIGFLRAQVALLEAQEALLRRRRNQG